MNESYKKPALRLIRPEDKEDDTLRVSDCEVLPDRGDAVNFLCALADSGLLDSDISDALGDIACCIKAEEITLNLWGCQRVHLEELFAVPAPQSLDEGESADFGHLMYEYSLFRFLEDFMDENNMQ